MYGIPCVMLCLVQISCHAIRVVMMHFDVINDWFMILSRALFNAFPIASLVLLPV
jgi:hypothetical protein